MLITGGDKSFLCHLDENGSPLDEIEMTSTSLEIKREAIKKYHETKGKWNF